MFDFFDFSNEMLCLADERGYFIRVNQAWTETLGWSAEELTSRPFLDFVHPEDHAATIREASLLNSGAHETIHFENRYRHRDGSFRWIAWRVRQEPITKQLVAAARDVTELQHSKQALLEEQDLLRNLIEVQEQEKQFLCQEFHDGLIQYAFGSMMLLESCRHSAPDAAQSTKLDTAIANLRRGIEDGRRVIRGVRPAVLDDCELQAAMDDLVAQFVSADLHITCKCDPTIGRLSESIQTTVYRVVQEALNNARKYSGTDVVRIELRRTDQELHFEVHDFGCGFDVDEARKNGFGLRGMTERVRLLGGHCQIESDSEGTRISARLPLK